MQVATAIEQGFREIYPDAQYVKLPMADGGEGTVESMVEATEGHYHFIDVTGPLGTPVQARWGILGDGKTAVIEMAAASGLHHVPPEHRNPLLTTSYGTGELILAALDRGVEHIILGIGGSATNDGGAGMLQALGIDLLDEKGDALPEGGGALSKLATIDTSHADPRLKTVSITVACDVNNPLCGPTGASAIFGPQKGATEAMVAALDGALAVYEPVLDAQARREISRSAAESTLMIAVSPLALVDMAFIAWRNLRLINRIATLYGMVRRIRGVTFRDVKQRGRRDVPEQTAEGQEKSNDFRTQHDRRHATHRFGAQPHHKRHQQGKAKPCRTRRHIQRHFAEGMVQNRTARRNIGVGQDIEHEGNRNTVDDVPAFAQQIFGDGVEA